MLGHIDADAFFASVLQRKYPRLKGKPLLALGMGGTCVIAASYEAKGKGVRTGMRLSEARALCPDMQALPSDFTETVQASEQLFAILEEWFPGGVERASIDEGYMDLAYLAPSAASLCNAQRAMKPCNHEAMDTTKSSHNSEESLARSLQSHILRFLDLSVSIGIAETKTLAKIGSKAHKPRGITIIHAANRREFLAGLPVRAIPGIGSRSTPKVEALGIRSALAFAEAPMETIRETLGKIGTDLRSELRGECRYDIVTDPPPPKSISRCRSFLRTQDVHFVRAQVFSHLQRCSAKLRNHGLECAGIGVWLRGPERLRAWSERKLSLHVCEDPLLIPPLRDALQEILHAGPLYTQTGIVLFDLRPMGARQTGLFETKDTHERLERTQDAIDTLWKRFGKESVVYGSALP